MDRKSNVFNYITDKRTIAERYGMKQPLHYKPNDRYKNIKNVVYTGPTMKNALKLSSSMIYKQRSELFKRIKPSMMVKLIVASQNKSIKEVNENEYDYEQKVKKPKEIDLDNILSNKIKSTSEELSEIDFIIVDLREEKEYHKCHIKNAISYPSSLISQDHFLKEMYTIKSKPNSIIIVYHKDDKTGASVSDLLILKGFENIYMISGGFYDFSFSYPEYMIGSEQNKYLIDKEKRVKEREIILRKRNKNHNRGMSQSLEKSDNEDNDCDVNLTDNYKSLNKNYSQAQYMSSRK
jgi:centrosomal protein CEP41